jgi:hypothetical protein
MNRVSASLAMIAVVLSSHVLAPEPKPLFQKPTLSATQIVFVYAGDLWIVGREGGGAKRLTNGAGVETRPYFSPLRTCAPVGTSKRVLPGDTIYAGFPCRGSRDPHPLYPPQTQRIDVTLPSELFDTGSQPLDARS